MPSRPNSSFNSLSDSFTWQADDVVFPLTSDVETGLSGVVACKTAIGCIDPAAGTLSYRGRDIESLTGMTFEEVAFLLIVGADSETDQVKFTQFSEEIRKARNIPPQVYDILQSLPKDTHPTRLLRASISALGCFEAQLNDSSATQIAWQDLSIFGQIAGLVGMIAQFRGGKPSVRSNETDGIAESLFIALNDKTPTATEVKLFNLVLSLYADHGLDAPTFTGMIVGSCLADPYYNVVAGLSALRGPLLGGTGERVLRQLLNLRDAHVARSWAKTMLSQGYIIPGFGHRMYRQNDPRAVILREHSEKYAASLGHERLLNVFRAVEDEVSPVLADKGIHININFYAALIFHMLGSEPEMIPCLYAVGRMAGLVARVREYVTANRIFRPLGDYVGPPEHHFVKRSER